MIARFAVFLGLAALFACTDETVVIADVPPVDGGRRDAAPAKCVESDDCPKDSFCARATCDAVAGTCEPFPTATTNEESPVCGCNNVTYFNDSLRRADGQSLQDDKWCPFQSAALCGGFDDHPCPGTGKTCVRLIPGFEGQCLDQQDPGTCWSLPDTCPDEPNRLPERWQRCGPNGGHCLDTCSAIRDGEPYRQAQHCAP